MENMTPEEHERIQAWLDEDRASKRAASHDGGITKLFVYAVLGAVIPGAVVVGLVGVVVWWWVTR
jgi:hypothetical protein